MTSAIAAAPGGPTPPCTRLGVLINRNSGRNRTGIRKVEAVLARHPDIVVRHTMVAAQVPDVLAEMAAAGVDVLAVNGGDGTLQLVMNRLMAADSPFPRPPLLGILPGGTTNMIATDVGTAARPAAELERLIARLRAGTLPATLKSRPLIHLVPGSGGPGAYGLFFGAAGVYEATLANRRSVDAMGVRDGLGPALRLAAIALDVARGRDPVQPVQVALTLDGVAAPPADYLAIFATTMERLALGMRPYWGSGPGRIHFTTIAKGAKRLLRAARPFAMGRPSPLLTTEAGYESRNADEIVLDFTGGCVLDGEIFTAAPGQPIRLEAAGPIAFVHG